MRGCDDFGNCANFVETEQLIETVESIASFVQTRGSIPLFWTQTPNVVQYKPTPVVAPTKEHLNAFVKHITEQMGLYGQQVSFSNFFNSENPCRATAFQRFSAFLQALISLIDQQKSEGLLAERFGGLALSSAIPGLTFTAFDFHKQCDNFHWEPLNHLIRDLQPVMKQFGYFRSTAGHIVSKQTGVFRTSCMDCLDRTNVVQSMISEQFVQDVLTDLGILNEGQMVTKVGHFHNMFRNMWANHANIISIQYAGTEALKTDFTRTGSCSLLEDIGSPNDINSVSGKRTLRGMLTDLQNSLTRYYKNNFADGLRQDAIDFFLGYYAVGENNGTHAVTSLFRKTYQ